MSRSHTQPPSPHITYYNRSATAGSKIALMSFIDEMMTKGMIVTLAILLRPCRGLQARLGPLIACVWYHANNLSCKSFGDMSSDQLRHRQSSTACCDFRLVNRKTIIQALLTHAGVFRISFVFPFSRGPASRTSSFLTSDRFLAVRSAFTFPITGHRTSTRNSRASWPWCARPQSLLVSIITI